MDLQAKLLQKVKKLAKFDPNLPSVSGSDKATKKQETKKSTMEQLKETMAERKK